MRDYRENLVQVEFFAPLMGESLNEVLSLAFNRSLEGDRIKTVVRFHDSGGRLSKAVTRLTAEESKTEHITSAWDVFLSMWGWSWIDRLKRRRIHTLRLAKDLLKQAVDANQVYVENPDWTFRPIERNEAHEIVEKVSFSWAAWYFIFAPGDLGTDTPGKTIIAQL